MEEAINSVPATVEIPGYLVGTWKADPVHSEIAFSVRHLVISKARGRFTSYDVTLVTSEDLLGSSVTATIDLASIDTGHEMRDNHLRSADYLEIDKYPTMSYSSTGIRQTGDGWALDGELTLHGVTRQVPLAVEVGGFGPDQWGRQRAGFSATAEINRSDFGIDISTPWRPVASSSATRCRSALRSRPFSRLNLTRSGSPQGPIHRSCPTTSGSRPLNCANRSLMIYGAGSIAPRTPVLVKHHHLREFSPFFRNRG